ncbi:MAG TPA: hypothetical protein VF658_13930 [Pyrinomonadaceae bacterium]|jgi:hypothetical protein
MASHDWRLDVQQFLLPKSGAELSECEDAIGINTDTLRFVVADGATEAFDSRSWARRLAERWALDEPPALSIETFQAWVVAQGLALHSSWNGRQLSWYAEEKARNGSFAAFVGVQFELATDAARWRAVALGDSCLIQLRDGAIRSALPISDYQNFTGTPLLVPSSSALRSVLARTVVASGSIEPGDLFLLLSDAAACWYLKFSVEREPLRQRFDFLLATAQNDDLTRLFEVERDERRIADDDVAILRIAVG